jgi:asparagine synthase (glutamine-hydrolysing)
MSAIAGLICLKRLCPEEDHLRVVRRMCDLQAHRGLDGSGAASMDRVSLGAGCLRITGHARAHNDDGELGIVYDGTIYNYSEIRGELSQRGYKFCSETDIELVLHAFEEWGEKCPERLTGMFAFAVHDLRAGTTTLIRDRFGMKPLYYTLSDTHVYFASEIKPLISKLCTVNANREALIEWSFYRSVLNSGDLIQGIYSVPPGHIVEFLEGELSSSRCYYSPVYEVDAAMYKRYANAPWQSVVDELSEAVDRSIQDCLTGDAPVGTLLSGGIDSSIMTALVARKRDVIALNVSVPDDPSMDERRQAEEVASVLGVSLVSRPVDRKTFLRALPRVIYLNESPLTHIQCVAFHFGAQLARENGVSTLLVGDAADTVLGGNWSRQSVLLRLGACFGHLPSRLRNALVDAMSSSGSVIPVRPFLNPEGVDFLDAYARHNVRGQCEEAYQFVTNAIDRSILATKLAHLMEDVSWYLQRGDRLGRAESVEYRAPFLDHRLIKMALNLTWSYQTRGLTDKWALRKVASRFLPHQIAYRKKVPWDLPLKSYLAPFASKSFFKQGVCLDVLKLNEKAIDAVVETYERHLQSFFNLVNLELWGRLFLLQQPVEEIEELITKTQAE